MGKTMSKLRGQMITRPIQRFNIESRTEKILSQEKPTPAPKYQTDIDLLEKIRHENPEIFEETRNRNSLLDQRLKQVWRGTIRKWRHASLTPPHSATLKLMFSLHGVTNVLRDQVWAFFCINTMITYISVFIRFRKYKYDGAFHIFSKYV